MKSVQLVKDAILRIVRTIRWRRLWDCCQLDHMALRWKTWTIGRDAPSFFTSPFVAGWLAVAVLRGPGRHTGTAMGISHTQSADVSTLVALADGVLEGDVEKNDDCDTAWDAAAQVADDIGVDE